VDTASWESVRARHQTRRGSRPQVWLVQFAGPRRGANAACGHPGTECEQARLLAAAGRPPLSRGRASNVCSRFARAPGMLVTGGVSPKRSVPAECGALPRWLDVHILSVVRGGRKSGGTVGLIFFSPPRACARGGLFVGTKQSRGVERSRKSRERRGAHARVRRSTRQSPGACCEGAVGPLVAMRYVGLR
jgi:hypothetical protein